MKSIKFGFMIGLLTISSGLLAIKNISIVDYVAERDNVGLRLILKESLKDSTNESHVQDFTQGAIDFFEAEEIIKVLKIDDQIIGACVYDYNDDYQESDGYIAFIGILQNHRDNGYASMLLTDAILDIQKQGFKTVSLTVADDNLSAVKLYEKLGFKHVGRNEAGNLMKFSKKLIN